MEKVMLLCRSMTHAQRCVRLLEQNGIMGSVIKAPVSLTRTGCGYAVILRRHWEEGLRIIRNAGLLTGRVYRKRDEEWSEITHDLS